ncbi:MAG TPA: hypothetical protein VHX38_02795 [Pseudonocardiaceae bacterium]|nr:hypothetical protein [Pseudonocardiaceae bacterium]
MPGSSVPTRSTTRSSTTKRPKNTPLAVTLWAAGAVLVVMMSIAFGVNMQHAYHIEAAPAAVHSQRI